MVGAPALAVEMITVFAAALLAVDRLVGLGHPTLVGASRHGVDSMRLVYHSMGAQTKGQRDLRSPAMHMEHVDSGLAVGPVEHHVQALPIEAWLLGAIVGDEVRRRSVKDHTV